jgi:hypothetical protein
MQAERAAVERLLCKRTDRSCFKVLLLSPLNISAICPASRPVRDCGTGAAVVALCNESVSAT